MKTGRLIGVVALALALFAGSAAAQSVTPVGWADDGAFVVSYRDPHQAIEWSGGAEEFLARCESTSIESELSCTVCADTAACGMSGAAKAPKPAKAAPNKKTKVTDKRACTSPKSESFECTRTIGLGAVGTLTLYESNPRKKGTLSVFFRPDSGAAAILLVGESASDEAISVSDLAVVAIPVPPPVKLDAKVIKEIAAGAAATVKKCGEGAKVPKTVNVRFVIQPSGNVNEASLLNAAAFAETSAGECITEAVLALQFPIFTGKEMIVKLPFLL